MARVPAAFGVPADRPFPAVLWIAAAISLVAALSPRDLWAPDEPRYGCVARAMVAENDWLVPHVNGEPYAEKPPFVFWLMSVGGILLGGVGAIAARLPGALATAVAVFSVARLARRWFGDPAMGDTAALLFATTELVLWNGSRAGLDLPMTAFGLLAIEGGSAVVAKQSVGGALGFGAALGLGVLSKGPHALLVPVAAIVGGCVAVKAKRRLLDPRWLLGLALAAAVVCAWLLPALAAGGTGYRDRLLGQLSDRLSGESVPHRHGPEHLWLLLPAIGLPWTIAWLSGLAAAWRWRNAPPEDRFGLGACLMGVLAPLVLLSIPASKRDLYLIPLLPLLSILAAYALHRLPERRLNPWAVRGAAALLAAVAVGAFAGPFLGSRLWPGEPGDAGTGATLAEGSLPFALGAVGLLAAVGALAGFRAAPRPVLSARLVGIGFAAAWLTASTAVLPAFDDAKSFRSAATIAWREAPGARLIVTHSLMADISSLLWGFGRTKATWWSVDDLPTQMEEEALTPTAPPTIFVTRAIDWDGDLKKATPSATALLRGARILWRGRVPGSRFDYLVVTNVPEK